MNEPRHSSFEDFADALRDARNGEADFVDPDVADFLARTYVTQRAEAQQSVFGLVQKKPKSQLFGRVAAATILFGICGGMASIAFSSGQEGARAREVMRAALAMDVAALEQAMGRTTVREPAERIASSASVEPQLAVPPVAEQQPAEQLDPTPEEPTTEAESATVTPTAAAPAVMESHVARIKPAKKPSRSPEDRAKELWREGDLAGAARILKTVVASPAKTDRIELAYGDLFTLARKIHGPGERIRLWNQYLAAFPQGRYADHARSSLCRYESGRSGTTCWTKYLNEFPDGAHRAEANRRLGPKNP